MRSIRVPLPVKLAASLLLLGFVLLKVDFAASLAALRSSNFPLVFLALLTAFVSWFINTFKWQVLLAGPGTHLTYRDLLRLNFIGLFYNLVLPGQVGGEVIKGVALSRMGVSKVAAAVSVVADRVTGLLALFLLGLFGIALSPQLAAGRTELLPWVAVLTLALVVVSVVLVTGRAPALALTVGRALKLSGGRLDFLSRVTALPQDRELSAMLAPMGLSLVVQGSIVLMNLFVCMALDVRVSYLTLLWIVAVVSLLQSLPISIAGIGIREGAYVFLLNQVGVPTSLALGVSLLVFVVQVVLASIGGVWQVTGSITENS